MTSTSFNQGYSLSRLSSKVIQPPGGQTADIFGSRDEKSYSSASSQAGSDVASARMQSEASVHQQQQQQQVHLQSGQISPASSLTSAGTGNQIQQPLLLADDFKPNQELTNLQQQKLIQAAQGNMANDALNRTPKKTIPTIRRNPITGEVYENPSGQQMPVRVRQPPGGKSSGIF